MKYSLLQVCTLVLLTPLTAKTSMTAIVEETPRPLRIHYSPQPTLEESRLTRNSSFQAGNYNKALETAEFITTFGNAHIGDYNALISILIHTPDSFLTPVKRAEKRDQAYINKDKRFS